jgi:Na+/pantothenate symporter
MNVVGVISIVFFYCLILAVGLWAGKKKHTGNSEEEVMLAGRNIGLFVGIFTMTGNCYTEKQYIQCILDYPQNRVAD